MSNRPGRHMASSRGNSRRSVEDRRREPLRDNYTYEQPGYDAGSRDNGGFEDVSSYSSAKKKKEDQKELERQRKQGMSRGKKALLITLAVVVLLVAAGAWYVFGYLLKDLTVDRDFTTDREKLGLDIIMKTVSGMPDDEPVVLDDSIKNIALFGVDARGNSFEGLSDVVMILTVDNKHDCIKMTSILRDSCVIMEDGSYAKLTEIYSWGGPELAVNTLNRNFSIGNHPLNITEYVTVNFAKMAQIIDAVGGVDIELTPAEVQQINLNMWSLIVDVEDQIAADKYMGTYEHRSDYAYITNDDMLPNIYGNKSLYSADYEYEGGNYHLNGNQAVAYGRIRYIDSDDKRAGRQQNVLKALIYKVKGMSKLEYPEMIRKIMPMVKTSLDFADISAMLPIMFTDFDIRALNIPGEAEDAGGGYVGSGENARWVYVYDLDFAAMHINTFIYEDDSPYFGQDIYPGIGTIPYVNSYYTSADKPVEPPTSGPEGLPPSSSSALVDDPLLSNPGVTSEVPGTSEIGPGGNETPPQEQEPTGNPEGEEPPAESDGGGEEWGDPGGETGGEEAVDGNADVTP